MRHRNAKKLTSILSVNKIEVSFLFLGYPVIRNNIRSCRLRVHDLPEIRLERRAANQTAVDVRLGQKLRRIGSVHGTAVLDANRLCGSCVVHLSDAVTDALTYLLRLIGSSCLAGSDRKR